MLLYEDLIWGDRFREIFPQFFCKIDEVSSLPKEAEFVITHNGDSPVIQDLLDQFPNLRFWAGQNICCDDLRCFPLPIGVENNYISGQPARKKSLVQFANEHRQPTKLCYVNFNRHTHPDRDVAYSAFLGQPWATNSEPVPYDRFCKDVLDHQFVICPRGNGLDCHRSWEVLYLGRCPVMKRMHSLEALFEDLPVVFVDDWRQVTKRFLRAQAKEFQDRSWNFEKLQFSWWKKEIERMIQEGQTRQVYQGRVIQMSRLGKMGRHGNCLIQSAFLASYAKMHNLRVEAIQFPGQERYPIEFDPIVRLLPSVREHYTIEGNRWSGPLSPKGEEFVQRDWRGWGQFHTRWYRPYREMIQRMLTPKDHRDLRVGSEDKTWIGIHYRAGDYNNTKSIWRPPLRWYLNWLEQNWDRFKNPRLLVASEDREFVDLLGEYLPGTAKSLGLTNDVIDEWTVLRYCDVVVMPNSSFSFTAAWANPNLKEAWRASLPKKGFVQIDPWDADPHDWRKCEDYPEIFPHLASKFPGIKHLTGVLVCIDYSDYLQVTLPHNKRHFDRFVVVTSAEDKKTQEVCEHFDVECIISKRVHENGADLAKGRALNDALLPIWSSLDWTLVLDADIVLQSKFRKALGEQELDMENLYWTQRQEPPPEETEKFFRLVLSGVHPEFVGKHPHAISLVPLKPVGPNGYFQLFNAKAEVLKNSPGYSEGSSNARKDDLCFAEKWPKELRLALPIPAMRVFHLPHRVDDEVDSRDDRNRKINWRGRRSPRLKIK